jgi:hypothetical protein
VGLDHVADHLVLAIKNLVGRLAACLIVVEFVALEEFAHRGGALAHVLLSELHVAYLAFDVHVDLLALLGLELGLAAHPVAQVVALSHAS